jgi:hypothetical protein
MRIASALFTLALVATSGACTTDDTEAPGSTVPGSDGNEVDGGTQVDGDDSDSAPGPTDPDMTPAPNPNAGGGAGTSGGGATP